MAETWQVRVRDRRGNLSAPATLQVQFETPRTVFGVAPPGGEMAAHRAVYGGTLGYPRFFFAPGKVPGWDLWPLKNLQPGDVPVVSAKTWYPDAFRVMLDEAPVDEWWYCQNHEPEDDFATGALTSSEYAIRWEEVRRIRDEHPRGGQCKLVPILNWYRLTQKVFPWQSLRTVLELGDAIGVDSYALTADAARNVYTSPAALFGPAIEIGASLGKPWAVPEFAAKMAADGDKVRHAAQLRAYIDYARVHGAKWVSWWCNPAGAYIEHLEASPIYDQAFALWKATVRTP